MLKLILRFSIVLIIFNEANSCANDENEAVKPKVNCIETALEIGVEWRTFSLPHVTDCTKFYGCSGSGELVEMICADTFNTRFDPFHHICEWNTAVECITYYDFLQLNKTHSCE